MEDMDLAVRASLRGWKFVYLGDLQVKKKITHLKKKPTFLVLFLVVVGFSDQTMKFLSCFLITGKK